MKPIGNGIELDNDSKPEFCEACTKAKSATKPFPKESETRAKKFGDRVHWDLWGPAAVKSLNGHHYVAVRIDDATRETKPVWKPNQNCSFRLRGRIPISAKWHSQMRNAYKS